MKVIATLIGPVFPDAPDDVTKVAVSGEELTEALINADPEHAHEYIKRDYVTKTYTVPRCGCGKPIGHNRTSDTKMSLMYCGDCQPRNSKGETE